MTLLYCTSFGGYRVGGERTDLDPNWQFPASVNPLEAGVLLPGRASARRAFVQETNRQLAYMALDVSGLSVSDTWIIGQAFRIEHPRLEDRTRRPPLLTFMDSTGATDSVRVYARGGTLSVRSRGQNRDSQRNGLRSSSPPKMLTLSTSHTSSTTGGTSSRKYMATKSEA